MFCSCVQVPEVENFMRLLQNYQQIFRKEPIYQCSMEFEYPINEICLLSGIDVLRCLSHMKKSRKKFDKRTDFIKHMAKCDPKNLKLNIPSADAKQLSMFHCSKIKYISYGFHCR